MSRPPLVAEVVRGSIIESVHEADLVVVDQAGSVAISSGDPLRHAAFRSAAKPLQAGVMMERGWIPADDRDVAIACASHNGEPEHVDLVMDILARSGLSEGDLRCPAALPSETVPHVVAAAGLPAPRFHNCSGQHAVMLALCAARGWPLSSYREPQHPLQQAIHEALEHSAGTLLEPAVDGCGIVTYGAPLAAIARAFGSIEREDVFRHAALAMRTHPFLVAGTGRLVTAVMEAIPDLTVKEGAEGLVCAAGPGFALALKVRDGSSRAFGPLLFEGLRLAGALPEAVPESLVRYGTPPVLGGGRPAGEIRLRS